MKKIIPFLAVLAILATGIVYYVNSTQPTKTQTVATLTSEVQVQHQHGAVQLFHFQATVHKEKVTQMPVQSKMSQLILLQSFGTNGTLKFTRKTQKLVFTTCLKQKKKK